MENGRDKELMQRSRRAGKIPERKSGMCGV
jgi:hypothetical protein